MHIFVWGFDVGCGCGINNLVNGWVLSSLIMSMIYIHNELGISPLSFYPSYSLPSIWILTIKSRQYFMLIFFIDRKKIEGKMRENKGKWIEIWKKKKILLHALYIYIYTRVCVSEGDPLPHQLLWFVFVLACWDNCTCICRPLISHQSAGRALCVIMHIIRHQLGAYATYDCPQWQEQDHFGESVYILSQLLAT